MKNKIIINICIILSFVIIIILAASYELMGGVKKDINSSKKFMSQLYSIEAIDTTYNLNDLNYEKVKTINSQNELVNKTIVNENYGIDLDKHNNIVGFTKRDIKKGITKISEEEARQKSEQYLSEICSGDELVYEEINEDDNLPYYSFIYKKKENGYKLYFEEIKININKENGYMDGYSNSTMQKNCTKPEIKISKEEADGIAYEYYSKYNIEIQVENDYELVYADNRMSNEQNNDLEVCYLINVEVKNSEGSDINYKVFINADTGEIYNSINDNTENKVSAY